MNGIVWAEFFGGEVFVGLGGLGGDERLFRQSVCQIIFLCRSSVILSLGFCLCVIAGRPGHFRSCLTALEFYGQPVKDGLQYLCFIQHVSGCIRFGTLTTDFTDYTDLMRGGGRNQSKNSPKKIQR